MRFHGFGRAILGSLLLLGAAPAAGYHLDKTLALQPGGRFILGSSIGDVILIGDAQDGARIQLDSTLDQFAERYDVRFEERGGLAKVTIERHGGWTAGFFGGGWFGGQSTKIEVHVPRQTAIELATSGGSVEVSDLDGSVKVASSGGAVEVHDVRGEVNAESSGGGVRMAGIEGGVTAESSGGGLDLERVSGAIRAESSGGGVRVREAGDRVEASSSGGPVKVAFANGNAAGGSIESSGGGVQIQVDPAVGLSIDAASSGGSVDCDLPVTVQGRIGRDKLHGSLNGGGATLRVRSSGGGVSLGAAR